MVTKEKPKGVYRVSLALNNEKYKQEDKNLLDAFHKYDQLSLFAKGVIIKTPKNYLQVKKGKKSQTEYLTGWQVRRFFASPMFRKLTAKRFAL